MVGRLPDSDDEELVRNAMTQARNMGQKIARAVTRSPLSSLRSSPAPHSPSPPALSTPLPVLVRGAPPPAPAPSSALERRLRGLSPHSRSPSPPSAAFYQSEAREVSLPQEQALCSNCASRPPLLSRENTPLSPTMPANPNAAGKGRQSTVGTDADSIMPLLFAAIGNPAVSFKKMAAMDSEGRTESSFEHKFRKWRQQARDLAEKFPEIAGPAPERTPKKPRAAPAKKSTNGEAKQTDVGDGHDGDAGEADAGGVKHSGDNLENEAATTEGSSSPIPANGKAKAKATKATATNGDAKGRKKRGSQDVDADADNEETPGKKPKVVKKGTAKVVKKSGSEDPKLEATEDVVDSVEGKAKAKPKANSRAKAIPKSKPEADNKKKPQAPKVKAETAEPDPAGPTYFEEAFDPELLDAGGSDTTEMKFEMEA